MTTPTWLYTNEMKEKTKQRNMRYRTSNYERYLYNKVRNRCKHSGREFTINLEDIIIPSTCPLLNVSFDLMNENLCPSLDRIDNTKGYIQGNVWVISTLANRMKSTATLEQLEVFSKNLLLLREQKLL